MILQQEMVLQHEYYNMKLYIKTLYYNMKLYYNVTKLL